MSHTKKVQLPPKLLRISMIVFVTAALIAAGITAGSFLRQQTDQEVETLDPVVSVAQRARPVQPAAIPKIDLSTRYPFMAPENTDSIPVQPDKKTTQTMRTEELPLIPNRADTQKMSVSNLPKIPGAARDSVDIQGILTGGNGVNIAILKNGKIVKEGDTVETSRIAVINQDGIQLDNGNTIPYSTTVGRK